MYEDEVYFEDEEGNVADYATDSDDDYADSDDDYADDRGEFDASDPRQREHAAYKIVQDNAGRAARRFKYGDDVDDDGTNHSPDERDNKDPLELRLKNAEEARGWAFE